MYSYYPEHHLHTTKGQKFITSYRAIPPSKEVDSFGNSHCTSANDNRTTQSLYPLYKVSTQPWICTGIDSFSSFNQDGSSFNPEILLTYDATWALGKSLHYLLTEYGITNTTTDLNNMLYQFLVTNDTSIKIYGSSGLLHWYSGYEKADYFGQGDRTTGHSFLVLNYFSQQEIASTGVKIEDGLGIVGYFNASKDEAKMKAAIVLNIPVATGKVAGGMFDQIAMCKTGDTIDGAVCEMARYRTPDVFTPARDMRSDYHIYDHPQAFKIIYAVVGAVCLFAAVVSLSTLYYFRTHRLVKYAQPPAVALSFFGYFILSIKILASQARIDHGYCIGDKWLAHIGFAASFLPLIVKLWRLDTIVNSKSLKRIKITDMDAFKVSAMAISGLIILLIVDSCVAYLDSPDGFFLSQRALDHNQFVFTHFGVYPDNPQL